MSRLLVWSRPGRPPCPSERFRDGDNVFRTYFINSRGDEAMGSTRSYTCRFLGKDWSSRLLSPLKGD